MTNLKKKLIVQENTVEAYALCQCLAAACVPSCFCNCNCSISTHATAAMTNTTRSTSYNNNLQGLYAQNNGVARYQV